MMAHKIDYDALQLLHTLYDSLNFPYLPLEESIQHSLAKAILHNATLHLMGGYSGRQASSIPEEGVA